MASRTRFLVEGVPLKRAQALVSPLVTVQPAIVVEIPNATWNDMEALRVEAAKLGIHLNRLPDQISPVRGDERG